MFSTQTVKPSVLGLLTKQLMNGASLLTSRLTTFGGTKLERTGDLRLCHRECKCDRHHSVPLMLAYEGKSKKGPPPVKTKKEKSKHHMRTLQQFKWTAREVRIMGVKEWNKFIFEPARGTSGALMNGMEHLDGWYVARTRPKNKKYRWSIVQPADIYGPKKIVRHKQSGRPMRFSTPANAIIAAEKLAAKHRAYHT
jgi:hypothetical protein